MSNSCIRRSSTISFTWKAARWTWACLCPSAFSCLEGYAIWGKVSLTARANSATSSSSYISFKTGAIIAHSLSFRDRPEDFSTACRSSAAVSYRLTFVSPKGSPPQKNLPVGSDFKCQNSQHITENAAQ